MPPERKEKKRLPKETWKNHEFYDRRMSYGSILTRSQTPFNRVKNTNSDMDFFSNGILHHPSTKPHVMVSMCGEYGAIPRTIVTRSAATQLEMDNDLQQVLKEYKKLAKTDPLVKELKEYQKNHPDMLNPGAVAIEVETSAEQSSVEETTDGESSAGIETSGSGSSA